MKLTIALLPVCVFFLACGKPDPYDEVRSLRRQFKIEIDFTVNNEKKEVVYEVKVQNLASAKKLKDLTVEAKAMDSGEQVYWSKRHELDVSGIGSYATETFQFREVVEVGVEQLEYFSVDLAPDDADSDFESYKEFMRVVR